MPRLDMPRNSPRYSAGGNPPEVILSVNEWYNLLNALQTVIERYGLERVEEAIDHFKVTGKF